MFIYLFIYFTHGMSKDMRLWKWNRIYRKHGQKSWRQLSF